jgi:SAM-dependent methyltransferase
LRSLAKKPVVRLLQNRKIRTKVQNLLADDALKAPGRSSAPPTSFVPPIQRHPERYSTSESFKGPHRKVVILRDEEDYGWMEDEISDGRYYETSRPWGYEVDIDKKAMASVAQYFRPRSVLDVGCSNGPLVKAMLDVDIDAKGIDISEHALRSAVDGAEGHLILGDIQAHNFGQQFDLIFALDLLEHLNPFKLKPCLNRIRDLLTDNGVAYFNIPVWGEDRVWGTVFPLSDCSFQAPLREWVRQYENNELFTAIPVDDEGFPELGHLVWAGTNWWLDLFDQVNLTRLEQVESEIHQKIDWFYNIVSIARRSFYVLAKDPDKVDGDQIISRIRESTPESLYFRIY